MCRRPPVVNNRDSLATNPLNGPVACSLPFPQAEGITDRGIGSREKQLRRQIERFPNEFDLGFANRDLANHRPDRNKSEPGDHVHEFHRHHLAPLICVDTALPCREPSIRGFTKIIGQQVDPGKAFR